jgi:hypothetical protein
MEKTEVDGLGLSYTAEIIWVKYHLTNVHLNAIKVFHEVCGYGGEDGEERLLSLFDFPRAQVVSRFKGLGPAVINEAHSGNIPTHM